MGNMTDEQLREYCIELERYSTSKLERMIHKAEKEEAAIYGSAWGYEGGRIGFMTKPDFIKICTEYLKKNSDKVNEIIKKHHNDIATMVYSVGVVVGNQLIVSGEINEMTAVYTVLMYLGKIGFDKVLAGSK